MTFLLQLIIIHLLGDFVFQPTSWIKKRNHKGIYSKQLYYHIGIHAFLLVLIFSTQLEKYYFGILFIISTHFCIDVIKIYFEKKYNSLPIVTFLADQLAHFIVLFLVVNYYFPLNFQWDFLNEKIILVVVIALISIIYVCPILLRLFFTKWSKTIKKLNKGSLLNAGKYIGIIERLLIVIFIISNFFEGIGYLLAAKSIFRFGDLTNSKEKKLTEYIVLGTFVSFLLGILIGFGLKFALQYFT